MTHNDIVARRRQNIREILARREAKGVANRDGSRAECLIHAAISLAASGAYFPADIGAVTYAMLGELIGWGPMASDDPWAARCDSCGHPCVFVKCAKCGTVQDSGTVQSDADFARNEHRRRSLGQ